MKQPKRSKKWWALKYKHRKRDRTRGHLRMDHPPKHERLTLNRKLRYAQRDDPKFVKDGNWYW
jgi:hypothetical protein